jgi:hypothetical protein
MTRAHAPETSSPPARRPATVGWLRFGEAGALAASLAWTAVLWVVCCSVFAPAYGSNDDPARAMIVSGTGNASAPDEHLPFSNILLGKLLRALYVEWPGQPWYDYALAGATALGHAVLAYAGLRAAPDRSALVLYAGWLGAALGLATILQFTMAAFAAAQGGLLLAASLVARPAAGRARAYLVTLAVCVAWIGALVRPDAFWLALGLTLPPAALLCWGRPWRRVAPFAVVVGGSAAAALVADAHDRRYYARDPAWAESRQLQTLVHDVMDQRRPDETEPAVAAALKRAGWSRNDFRLFQAWFYPNEAVFNRGSLQSFLTGLPPPEDRLGRGRQGMRRVARSPLLVPISLALLAAGLTSWPSRRHLAALAGAVAVAAAALLFLAVMRKLPGHVWIMVVLFPPACALAMRAALPPGGRPRSRLAVAAVLAAGALSWSVAAQWGESLDRRKATAVFLDSLERVPRPQGELLLVTWGPTFPYEAAPAFRAAWTPPGLRLFSLGWPHRTPPARATLARMGIHDLARALAWDPRVALAAPPEAGPLLERYVRRHAATRVRFAVATATPSFTVLRGVDATAAPGGAVADEPDQGDSALVLESAAPEQQ